MQQFKHHFPVCFISDELICTYKYGCFYIINILDKTITPLISLSISAKERIFSKVNFLIRLFRIGVRGGKHISDKEILFVHKKTIYNLDVGTKSVIAEYKLKRGSRPLSFANIQDIEGFENGIYFGEYFDNTIKSRVDIFRRDDNGKWHVTGFFPQGAINHIHTLIPDHLHQCVWILTGDFENASGIWCSKDGFQTLEPILIGHQNFRACVAFPTEEGLLYATDTPFCQNSIRLLKKSGDTWVSKKIIEIDGPVIYGCKIRNLFVFSTSVEGNGTEKGLNMLLGNKRGKGIKEPISWVYSGNLESGFKKVYHEEKDFLPFNLFQYGVIVFPEGENKTGFLPLYSIGLKNKDLTLQILELKN